MVIAMRDRSVIISNLEFKTALILEDVTERTLQRMKVKANKNAKYNKRVRNRKKLFNKR